jgi:hypothetical protein
MTDTTTALVAGLNAVGGHIPVIVAGTTPAATSPAARWPRPCSAESIRSRSA